MEYYYQQDFIEFFIFYFYESVDLRKLSPCSLVLTSDGSDKLCENKSWKLTERTVLGQFCLSDLPCSTSSMQMCTFRLLPVFAGI